MRAAYIMILAVACLCSAGVRADPLSCLIQPYQEADIGTQVVGVIDHVLVERGDFVKKGQPVVQLNSDVERAALAAAKLRAEATADLRAAASNHEFAQKKKVRTDDLYQKNFVSQQATDQASTEAQVAEMKLRQAREQQRLAQQELALAQAQLAQRTIRSPLSGVVVEKYLSEGERVEEKAVVKVATIDPLKVEVIVPASYFSKIKQGMGANVKPDMQEATPQAAKVVVVDKVIDAASNSFRVRLELPNPNYQLPPGLRCKVDFDLNSPTADNVQPKPATRPAADNVQPKPATAPSADNAQQKPAARPSVAAAATK
jgi:membrane fusion protein, heavy metal efflux system